MSAWILPQLQDNSENEDGLVLTESEGSWFGKFDKSKEFDIKPNGCCLTEGGSLHPLNLQPNQGEIEIREKGGLNQHPRPHR